MLNAMYKFIKILNSLGRFWKIILLFKILFWQDLSEFFYQRFVSLSSLKCSGPLADRILKPNNDILMELIVLI